MSLYRICTCSVLHTYCTYTDKLACTIDTCTQPFRSFIQSFILSYNCSFRGGELRQVRKYKVVPLHAWTGP